MVRRIFLLTVLNISLLRICALVSNNRLLTGCRIGGISRTTNAVASNLERVSNVSNCSCNLSYNLGDIRHFRHDLFSSPLY